MSLLRSTFLQSSQHGRLALCRRALSSYRGVLDLGGVPEAKAATRIANLSKAHKVQAVCFDWGVLNKSMDQKEVLEKKLPSDGTAEKDTVLGKVTPDVNQVNKIQEIAAILNVKLGAQDQPKRTKEAIKEDDLSLLSGEKKPKPSPHHFGEDVRSKYAAKLQRVTGDLVDISSREAPQGDAAMLLAAKKMTTTPASPTRWMAQTGTGQLLDYITHRSMKIVLLPSSVANKQEEDEMLGLTKQLTDVVFDRIFKGRGEMNKSDVVKDTLDGLKLEAHHVLIVSDRDDYLKAARDAGMVTCRVRPLNAPGGNISAHYNIPTIPELEQLINDINGISFKALGGR
jgi:hypothetical protein